MYVDRQALQVEGTTWMKDGDGVDSLWGRGSHRRLGVAAVSGGCAGSRWGEGATEWFGTGWDGGVRALSRSRAPPNLIQSQP